MSWAFRHRLVLALYPFSRGIAFVLFEGPLAPFDWGIKEFRNTDKNAASLGHVEQLIELYQPSHIVIEEWKDAHRSARILGLYASIEKLAQLNGVSARASDEVGTACRSSGRRR